LVFELSMLSFSPFHMASFDTSIDFCAATTARVIQAPGLAFLFVPINTAASAFPPREKNNAASGLINLSRNIGGSMGIAVVATMLAHRAQLHQVNFAGHINPGSGTL
jgi:DHA2 family multidrug resistance protein